MVFELIGLLPELVLASSLYASAHTEIEWQTLRRELAQRGVLADYEEMMRDHGTPEEEDFVACPEVQEMLDTRARDRLLALLPDIEFERTRKELTDMSKFLRDPPAGDPARAVLEALRPAAAYLERIGEAARRPGSRPLPSNMNIGKSAPYVVLALRMRGLANLRTGGEAEAMEDLTTLFHLRRHFAQAPAMVWQVMTRSPWVSAEIVMREGMRHGHWSEASLEALSGMTGSIDEREELFLSARGDLATTLRVFRAVGESDREYLREMSGGMLGNESLYLFSIPHGRWLLNRNRIRLCEIFVDHYMESEEGVLTGRVNESVYDRDAQMRIQRERGRPLWGPVHALALVSLPTFVIPSQQRQRQRRRHALCALALERYRIEQGSYPEHLDALERAMPGTASPDLFGDGWSDYRLDGDGRPRLASVGRGGVLDKPDAERFDDIVWSYDEEENYRR